MPISYSILFSGSRSALPGLSGDTPARSSRTVLGVYVWNWSKAPGALPAMPMAARSFRLLAKPGR